MLGVSFYQNFTMSKPVEAIPLAIPPMRWYGESFNLNDTTKDIGPIDEMTRGTVNRKGTSPESWFHSLVIVKFSQKLQ